MLRPALKEVRMEARAEWSAFARAIPERNNLIPGLIESFKGFEAGTHQNGGKTPAGAIHLNAVLPIPTASLQLLMKSIGYWRK